MCSKSNRFAFPIFEETPAYISQPVTLALLSKYLAGL